MFRVVGLSDLITALNAVDRDLSVTLRAKLKEAGQVVAQDASTRLAELNPVPSRSAASIRPKVRAAGLVSVEQTIGRTTGKRPDWGATQMARAFLPAAQADQEVVAALVEKAIDDVVASHGF